MFPGVAEMGIFQPSPEDMGPEFVAVFGQESQRAVVAEQLVEGPVELGAHVERFAVPVIRPEREPQEPGVRDALLVPQVEQPFHLPPPAAGLGVGAHPAIHELAVGDPELGIDGPVIIGAVRGLGEPVGDDEALTDADDRDIRREAPAEREIVADVEVGVPLEHVSVPKIPVAPGRARG